MTTTTPMTYHIHPWAFRPVPLVSWSSFEYPSIQMLLFFFYHKIICLSLGLKPIVPQTTVLVFLSWMCSSSGALHLIKNPGDWKWTWIPSLTPSQTSNPLPVLLIWIFKYMSFSVLLWGLLLQECRASTYSIMSQSKMAWYFQSITVRILSLSPMSWGELEHMLIGRFFASIILI